MAIASAVGAATIDVPGSAPTIQAALDRATDGDEIVVADGVYGGPGNVNLDYGGRSVTVRSAGGDPTRCVIDCADVPGTRGVRFAGGEGPSAVLAGITITRGNQTGSFPNDRGAAVVCDGSSPTIRDCVFEANAASFGGGAIFCINGARPRIESCRFVGNTGERGGALFCSGGPTEPVIVDCDFVDNTGTDGGAVNCFFNSRPTLDGCTFTGNDAVTGGGGIRSENAAAPMIIACTFTGNTAGAGGGVEVIEESAAVIDGCVFDSNDALAGGGLCAFRGQPTVRDCVFRENTAVFGAGVAVAAEETTGSRFETCRFERNVAITNGGGLFARTSAMPTVRACVFIDNVAGTGGGIAVEISDAFVESCRFAGNRATFGGGLACDGGSAKIVNGIFEANLADTFGGAVYGFGAAVDLINATIVGNIGITSGGGVHAIIQPIEIVNSILVANVPDQIAGAGANVTFSLVEGGVPGEGNIRGDPGLLRPSCGRLTLTAGSPCIDAGHNDAVPRRVTTDAFNDPRFLDGTGSGRSVVDMGADEFDPDACRADLDGNGVVGFADLSTLLAAWGSQACSTVAADLNANGIVGAGDLALLLSAWGVCRARTA